MSVVRFKAFIHKAVKMNFILETVGEACYSEYRRSNRPQGVDRMLIEIPPVTGQSLRVVFLCVKTLMTNQINECQQCQNEHSKSHKVFEVK